MSKLAKSKLRLVDSGHLSNLFNCTKVSLRSRLGFSLNTKSMQRLSLCWRIKLCHNWYFHISIRIPKNICALQKETSGKNLSVYGKLQSEGLFKFPVVNSASTSISITKQTPEKTWRCTLYFAIH